MSRGKKILIGASSTLLGLVLVAQVIPYGREHDNPPVTKEPKWDSPKTRELAQKACFDCHSNESVWPWYSEIAPMSWLVYHDVEEGRAHLNFSEWDKPQHGWHEVVEMIEEGEMPLPIYIPLHPEADLSTADTEALITGLEKLDSPPKGKRRRRSAEESDEH